MKHHLQTIIAAVCTLSLLSCSKKAAQPIPGVDSLERISINIGLDEQTTKSEYAARKDFQINSIQVFVFDEQQALETDYYSAITPTQGFTSVTVATFTGPKTVYAVVNHSRITFAKDTPLSALETRLTDLSENTSTNLVMSGKNTLTVQEYDKNKNATASPQALNIYVKRLSSMIVLDKITVDFSKTSLAGASFTVKELYLKNVVGKSRLGVSGLTDTAGSAVLPIALSDEEHTTYAYWYNKGSKQASGAPGVTYDVWSYDCANVSGGASSIGRCLFAYPNKTTGDSHADSFDQRKTRLVMKAHVKKESVVDTDTYYVFDLPVLVANNVYNIQNITLTMLGKDNDDKDDDLQSGRITPIVTVDPWTNTTNLTYDF